MRDMLSFGDFSFDRDQRLLFSAGAPVPLTNKQARLLGLLICNPATVHSKEMILDAVWDGRTVSEQVVFQNISALRNIVGQNAIKTFPKRGYQWAVELDVGAGGDAIGGDGGVPDGWTRCFARRAIGAVLGALVLLTAGFLYQGAREAPALMSVHAIRFEARFEGNTPEALAALNGLMQRHTRAAEGIPAHEFLKSPYVARTAAGLSGDELLAAGVLRQANGQLVLDYIVQGERRHWHAYIEGKDAASIGEKLLAQLNLLQSSRYFTLQEDNAVSAELALLYERAPKETAVLAYLTEQALEEENLDVAGAYADNLRALSQESQSAVYETIAYWLKGRVALARNVFPSARQHLSDAEAMAVEHDLLFVQSELIKTEAEIAYAEGDFDEVSRLLIQSATLSRLAGDVVNEVRAYTLLSIMASKFGLREKAYEYLHHAKRLLADGKFDDSHYMLVNYHFALFSAEAVEKERWLRATLSRTLTPENAWVQDSAADRLVSQLLDEKRVDEAFDIATIVKDQATAHKLKAIIHRAHGERVLALQEAQAAFNLARINGKKWVAMPMALLLLELNGMSPEANEYRQYLSANRKGRWADWEHARLRAQGLN